MKSVHESNNDHAELGRLLEEALKCLQSTDLSGANAALKKACAEAATPCDDAGFPEAVGADAGVDDGAAPVGPRNESEDRG